MAIRGKIIKWFRYIGIGILLVIAGLFLFRNFILHQAINSLSDKVKKNYSADLSIKDARFTGLLSIQLADLSIISARGDTIATMDSIKATPSIVSLLLFRFKAESIAVSNGSINIMRTSDHPTSNLKHETLNYSDRLSHLLNIVFSRIPEKVELRNVYLNYSGIASSKSPRNDSLEGDSVNTHLCFSYFNLASGVFDGLCVDETGHQQWKMAGFFNSHKRIFNVKVVPVKSRASAPFIDQLFHTSIAFDSMNISFHVSSYVPLVFDTYIYSSNFSVYHQKLADDTIHIDHFVSGTAFRVGERSIVIDTNSVFVLNDIKFQPYFRFDNTPLPTKVGNTGKEYTLNVHTNTTPATDFFHSLPKGMFNATRDIKAEGTLEYTLHFKLNTEEPDSLEFTSELKKDNFRLQQLGEVNFFKINDEFVYTAYEHDLPYRTFTVGPSNPDYTPLDQISPYLLNAILTSEDGSFFFHNGFNEDAFRKSIAENYKKEGFARGGSTITMQLVKNVFLSRHKTVARKAEEALITWLIESNHLCSKERMFEVYLNIIELGPGIYGVGEASRFYFNKKPSQLTLSESIFIAGVLPHPKWFKYSFDEQGNLKPYLADYYRVVSNFLLKKDLITQQEYDAITPNVKLQGPAKNIVVPSDTIPIEDEEQ